MLIWKLSFFKNCTLVQFNAHFHRHLLTSLVSYRRIFHFCMTSHTEDWPQVPLCGAIQNLVCHYDHGVLDKAWNLQAMEVDNGIGGCGKVFLNE